ncbi:MAG: CAP domain-containing protein [Candidatus Sericytochromatia bacterium]
MTRRSIIPFGLLLVALTAACTPEELEAIGRVILEETGSPAPLSTVSPSPGASPSVKPTPGSVAYSDDERELYRLLMAYRAEEGLADIPLSPSLTTVARTHVEDLLALRPDGENCNLHSWSDSEAWTGGCYTRDHAKASVMWDKPRELTSYPGNGYEIAVGYYGTGTNRPALTPAKALASWKSSSGHNAVIINEGTWADTTWQAVGVGINGEYATVWFGKESDPAL